MTSPSGRSGTHRAGRRDRWAHSGVLLAGVAAVAVLVGVALAATDPLGSGSDNAAPSATTTATPKAATSQPVLVPPVPSPVPTTAAPTAPTPTAAPPTPTPSPFTRPALLVLNNSRIDGLAARAAADFRAGGWPVRGTGNFRGRIAMTTAYYDRGQEVAARALMRQFPRVRRVAPRFEGLPGSGLTVVVTRDYAR